MSNTISFSNEPAFEVGDRVRVVTSDTPFFGWTGGVAAVETGIELGVIHYLVDLDGLAVSNAPPCLFRQIQLAHSL